MGKEPIDERDEACAPLGSKPARAADLEQPLHCAKRSCGLKSPELLSYLVFVQVIVKMYSYLFSVFHDYTIKVQQNICCAGIGC